MILYIYVYININSFQSRVEALVSLVLRKHSSIYISTDLMSASFSNSSEIGNVYSLLDHSLVRSIEYGIEWNMLQHFVKSELMRIEYHFVSFLPFLSVIVKTAL